MPFEPGPFKQLSHLDLAFTAVTPNFTADAQDQLSELDTAGGMIDTWLPVMSDFGSEPEDLFADALLDNALSSVLISEAAYNIGNVSGIASYMGDTDTLFTAAMGFAPAAAWVNPPALYQAPDTTIPIANPGLPASGFDAANTLVVGQFSDRPIPNISLFNTTRVGQSNFWVADDFVISVKATPGDAVSVHGSQNGVDLGITKIGDVLASGLLVLNGTMDPSSIGVWHEDWYVNDAYLGSFDFVVYES